MKIVILHQTITDHDAIGNDIYHMYEILKEHHECFIYCNNLLSRRVVSIRKDELRGIVSAEENLIIYHHSYYWEEGEDILKKARSRIIIRYHNITPAHFFETYNVQYYGQCALGREQTRRLAQDLKEALWMGDSAYNLRDIDDAHPKYKAIVPPFNNIEAWSRVRPDNAVLKSLMESRNIQLLFVGRIAPNKGHKFLIEIVRDYITTYNANLCLTIIGKRLEGLNTYDSVLTQLIERYHLIHKVKLIGKISEAALLSYYLGSDFFVCCSEHEGFCVPIIEAQYMHLPVIARKTAAVEETLGFNQVILNDCVEGYSAAIKVLTENVPYREFIVGSGFKNYEERFSNTIISDCFKKTVENYMGSTI